MKKIALIAPYFGKFPAYFELHLESIRKNSFIDWIFFTNDKKKYEWPQNTKVIYMEFSELRDIVQAKFAFKINLEKPYKLCDFKPAYGYIFSNYLKEYDFWGHCDQDVIWGDIRNFLTDEMLDNYEFIYREGAFRLYQNLDKINNLFKKRGTIFFYEEVFASAESYGFDEALSIQRLAENNDVKIYTNDNAVADIDAFSKPLYIRRVQKQKWKTEAGIFRSIQNHKYQIFQWKDGKIMRHFYADGQIYTDEFMYIHLLKRNMKILLNSQNHNGFYIVPNIFIKINELKIDTLKEISMADVSTRAERPTDKVKRIFKKCFDTSKKQRKVIIRKRLYFIFEKFS